MHKGWLASLTMGVLIVTGMAVVMNLKDGEWKREYPVQNGLLLEHSKDQMRQVHNPGRGK
ncbi:hypothetical protein GCM10011571_19210 [Marinithermofilum abyssi]|uniref:Uncharacterized protein n=1 Tax=Marinithermofilum abyssi TaxID=1571185 RepID=A0A8J2YDJ1_9BACL|nr:hypothetical protein [Marinithermofilum abyssi]GGE17647.1 hypothetical protein GCM10011571_19210 [Marinithermofilum abyssi]